MNNDFDVAIIGAGGGGGVVAKELGEKGVKVVVLEAGPWYGNIQWPYPNSEQGAISSSRFEDLSKEILNIHFTDLESDMNDSVSGKFRWGPANRELSPWPRSFTGGGYSWQNSGVGGSTLHYYGNSPRAYPQAIDNVWPISYQEMVPYYEKVEKTLPVFEAPVTAKEDLFYYGVKKAGWERLRSPDVTSPGYRPQPNAILPPNLDNPLTGCTLRGHCVNGCHIGPSVDQVAKRSTLVSYIPLALKTGNVEVRPNAFVTKINTENNSDEGLYASSVEYRETWTGRTGKINAKVVVMAAGGIETPRLWLNSKLPENEWVGKGLVNHWFDTLSGIFTEESLKTTLGVTDCKPYVGQNAAARFDYPGLGVIETFGMSPGIYSSMIYATSGKGYSFMNKLGPDSPWDYEGMIVGEQLKDFMRNYTKTLSVLIFTDDDVNQDNSVTLHPELKDDNGFVPVIRYKPSQRDQEKRDKLANIAADILRKAGASTIIRSNWPPDIFLHITSTMRIGFVTDTNCEAKQVKRLFIADNSILFNGIGGPNPTLTTQALATRTSEKIFEKYFA